VSNPIRYDPLLVRALAAELHRTLAGRAAHPLPRFDSDGSATLLLDRGDALRLDLHPRRGWIRIVPRPGGTEALAADAHVVRAAAPPDERLLRIHLHEGNRFRGARRTLVVELHTNQWNALLVDDADGRIVSVLHARDAGTRALRPGAVYQPPPPAGRIAPDPVRREEIRALWMESLSGVAPGRRPGEAVRRFAWLGPINAPAVLGAGAREPGDGALAAAFDRWWILAEPGAPQPVLLRTTRGVQPYPAPLDGFPSEPQPTLLVAMEAAAAGDGEANADPAEPELAAPARDRLAAAERRLARLREEHAAAGDAEPVRALGDVLLSHLHRVQPGAASVVLPDFSGGEVEIALDPALRPHENAERYYARARRMSRAQARLPELIAAAEREVGRWSAAVEAAERGEPPRWLAAAVRRPAREGAAPRPHEAERLPYRAFRTSGGLEVRVGRSSRDNDRLTFGHAAPGDVWLHARSVAGSHVVLRWRADENPPARDLEEAAVLAALYSKARTSGTVAVDWTRRRHVRKPRGAAPGRVVLQRAQTVFVAPDPAVEARLAAG
jgi:predicted ribosome quality control (RQC) complex YloA/Tae2 family protein